MVHYSAREVSLEYLVRVHLHTHSSTSAHGMRGKYRSAVYGFSESETRAARAAIGKWQAEFERPIVTEAVRMGGFRQNTQRYQDYYKKNPEAPFCRRWVEPKLGVVEEIALRDEGGAPPAAGETATV